MNDPLTMPLDRRANRTAARVSRGRASVVGRDRIGAGGAGIGLNEQGYPMNKLMKSVVAMSAVAAAMVPAAMAQAATLVIDVAGLTSVDDLGSPNNLVQTYNLGANATVQGIAYDLTLTTVGLSWLSEATIAFEDSSQLAGVFLTPGFTDDFAGTGTYSGSAVLADLGLEFNVGADGILRVEFFESFDDVFAAIDANYISGTITITHNGVTAAVPEPASWALMIGGFGLVGGAMRRRNVKTSVTYA